MSKKMKFLFAVTVVWTVTNNLGAMMGARKFQQIIKDKDANLEAQRQILKQVMRRVSPEIRQAIMDDIEFAHIVRGQEVNVESG